MFKTFIIVVLALASGTISALAQIGPAPMLYQYQGPTLGGLWTSTPSAGTSVTGGSNSACSATLGGSATAGTLTSNCGIITLGSSQLILGTNSITLDPTSGGNIVLFSGQAGDTGMLQFANAANFIPATGLDRCPGAVTGKYPIGVAATFTGYIPFKDWLNNSHGWPVC